MHHSRHYKVRISWSKSDQKTLRGPERRERSEPTSNPGNTRPDQQLQEVLDETAAIKRKRESVWPTFPVARHAHEHLVRPRSAIAHSETAGGRGVQPRFFGGGGGGGGVRGDGGWLRVARICASMRSFLRGGGSGTSRILRSALIAPSSGEAAAGALYAPKGLSCPRGVRALRPCDVQSSRPLDTASVHSSLLSPSWAAEVARAAESDVPGGDSPAAADPPVPVVRSVAVAAEAAAVSLPLAKS
jgi:hypothetical protein